MVSCFVVSCFVKKVIVRTQGSGSICAFILFLFMNLVGVFGMYLLHVILMF